MCSSALFDSKFECCETDGIGVGRALLICVYTSQRMSSRLRYGSVGTYPVVAGKNKSERMGKKTEDLKKRLVASGKVSFGVGVRCT